MMNLLITGGCGYLGNTLYTHLKNEYNVLNISRINFDLANRDYTKRFFENKYFDVVIHCAIGGGIREIKDSTEVLDNNLKMYYNILECRENYNRFINFGSGAEIFSIYTPYGLSKKVIRDSAVCKEGFYNLRLFGLFDENELDSRFIKSNVKRYINKRDMVVYKNRRMDFFYMRDLISLVKYYIENENAPKEIDCVYEISYSLIEIANYINTLSNYKVKIIQESDYLDQDYTGKYTPLPIKFVGIEEGILNVYNKLL